MQEVEATVVSCSKAGRSCVLRLADGQEAKVNIAACEHMVLGGGADDAEDCQPSGSGESDDGEEGSDEDGSDEDGSDGDSSEDGSEEAGLDAFSEDTAAAVDAFTAEALANPSAFLLPSEGVAARPRAAAKALYDHAAASAAGGGGEGLLGGAGGPLAELYVDGFDPEQIWLQVRAGEGVGGGAAGRGLVGLCSGRASRWWRGAERTRIYWLLMIGTCGAGVAWVCPDAGVGAAPDSFFPPCLPACSSSSRAAPRCGRPGGC